MKLRSSARRYEEKKKKFQWRLDGDNVMRKLWWNLLIIVRLFWVKGIWIVMECGLGGLSYVICWSSVDCFQIRMKWCNFMLQVIKLVKIKVKISREGNSGLKKWFDFMGYRQFIPIRDIIVDSYHIQFRGSLMTSKI